MLSTIAIYESSEEKAAGYRWHNICSTMCPSGVGEEEGRTVVKRSRLPRATATVYRCDNLNNQRRDERWISGGTINGKLLLVGYIDSLYS
jgi:hypothetical protein